MKIHAHEFKNWEEIPDVSHLLEVENNYVHAFEHEIPEATSYVSYAVKDRKVVAFGSGTYFKGSNYYIDGDDDGCSKSEQKQRRLWIEGMVSIERGCGSLILRELEKWFSQIDIPHKIINIMSVDESIGFYEENGYVVCFTGPRFAGTGNTRVAKAIGDFDIQLAGCVDYTKLDTEQIEWEIAALITLGRRKVLSQFIDIPKDIDRKDYEVYVRNHDFKECVTEEMKKNIFDHLDEFKS